MAKIVIKDINPKMGLPGGSIVISGKRFQPWSIENMNLHFANDTAWIEGVSDTLLLTTIPKNSISGDVYIDIEGNQSNSFHFSIPEPLASGLHIVDNPVVDSEGNIYATFSGSRGEFSPVSVYKITKDKKKLPYVTGITNATSLAIDQNDVLYVASRLDGKVYKVYDQNQFEIFSQGIGNSFGLTFNNKGKLFVGDRSGSIFEIDSKGRASFYISVPQSYIAFHIAFDSKNNLYVSNPVHMGENSIYKINKTSKKSEVYYTSLSLFHGFVFDKKDNLYLAETKRNESRIIKIKNGKYVSTILTGVNFIGLAFDSEQNLIVATGNYLYFIDKDEL